MFNFEKTNYLSLLIFLSCVQFAWAQQSSKSKSKEIIYEKPGEIAQVDIRNVTAINSPSTDFAPSYFENGLVYASSKRSNGPRDKKTNETYFELYFSPFDPNGEPISPQQFSLSINSARHEGPVSFSRDYETIFFTRSNMDKGVEKTDHHGTVHLKIFEAQKGTYDWTNVRELPFNSDNYSCMHPSLSADGKQLFFASDMEGGFGGYDIYVVDKIPTGWSTPRNLGPAINTNRNEVFPFAHVGGDLFFSTSGHNSYGGLDIFVAKQNAAGWKVANLGKPFNSDADDLGIIMNDEADKGFFSSSRANGYGKDDIYSFSIRNGISTVEKPSSKRVSLHVEDENGRGIQGAAIRVLTPNQHGYVSGRNDFYKIDLQNVADNSNELNLKLVRKNAEDLGPADLYTNVAGAAVWEFNPYTTYLVLVDINGYEPSEQFFSLDNNGDKLRFQLRKAKACERVTGIITHDQFGKRVANCEVRFTNKNSSQQYTTKTDINGEFEICLPESGTYLYYANKEGFKKDANSFDKTTGKKAHLNIRLLPEPMTQSDLSEEPIKAGSRITINDIYYEYNKATLNESGVKHIEGLLQLLNSYPTMEIDLISHTDARGDAKLNMELSTKRADYAKNYLVYRGVNANRIHAIGKGESEIRNRCKDGVNCSEEEHAYNRRTEVLVRKM